MKYKIREITPKEYQCLQVACPAIYEGVREVTPKDMQCTITACPSIYKGVREITSKEMACAISACPSSYKAQRKGKEVYLILGKLVNPVEAGLESKVGEGEALIEVPKKLIDGIK